MKHLIIGAGPVGLHLAGVLAANGETVALMTRRAIPDIAGVQTISADVKEAGSAERFADIDTVYHCANAPYHRWAAELPGLWSAILTHAVARKCRRVVAATNLYSYGRSDGPFTADHPWNPHTTKGAVRSRIEGEYLEAGKRGDIEVSLVRAADFYGPLVTASVLGGRLFPAVLGGKDPEFMGSLDARHSYTYVGDFAATLAAVGLMGTKPRDQYLVPNARAVTARELTKLLGTLVGRSLKPKLMTKTVLRIGGLFIPAARESIEMLYEFEEDFVTDTAREEGEFDLAPTDLSTGLRLTLEWYSRPAGERGVGYIAAERKSPALEGV